MKTRLIVLFIAFVSSISIAQTKIGTIDNDFIINLMPESKVVIEKTQAYGAKLDSSFTVKMQNYQTRVADFRGKEAEMGELMKKTIVKELRALEQDLQRYQENGKQLIQLKQNELMRPLYVKLNAAISKVAKANKFTQILNTNGNNFAYIDENYDVTQLVLDELGIDVKAVKEDKE